MYVCVRVYVCTLYSVGCNKDYPTYIQENGLDYAKVRRALYHNRHKKDIDIKGSNGWLSSILLW